AFLYAFANALALRGLSIRQAFIQSVGAEAHDRFVVRDRQGRPLTGARQQAELRVTATLIKQFTHALIGAPDPGKALESFDRFLDVVMAGDRGALTALKDPQRLAALARIMGSSEFLWEEFLRRQHANLVPILDGYQRGTLARGRTALQRELGRAIGRARGDDARRRALNQFKDQQLFRIDMKHLLDPKTSLLEFSAALTELAEAVLDAAARLAAAALQRAHGTPRLDDGALCPFAIFGMGKFGGRELGYASDIEVLFVYGGPGKTDGRSVVDNSEYFERLSHEILHAIEAKQEGIFHVDVRLRPHGSKGLL